MKKQAFAVASVFNIKNQKLWSTAHRLRAYFLLSTAVQNKPFKSSRFFRCLISLKGHTCRPPRQWWPPGGGAGCCAPPPPPPAPPPWWCRPPPPLRAPPPAAPPPAPGCLRGGTARNAVIRTRSLQQLLWAGGGSRNGAVACSGRSVHKELWKMVGRQGLEEITSIGSTTQGGLRYTPMDSGVTAAISLLVICRLRRVLPNCSTSLRAAVGSRC